MEKPSTLSPQDLSLLMKAQSAVQQAQQLSSFVSAHLAEVYNLGERDQINWSTGEISRQEDEVVQ